MINKGTLERFIKLFGLSVTGNGKLFDILFALITHLLTNVDSEKISDVIEQRIGDMRAASSAVTEELIEF